MLTGKLSVLVQFLHFVGTVFANTDIKSLVLLPTDPYVCTSQNITFTCNDKSWNVSTLFFTLPGNNNRIMQNINGTKVNETASELTLYNISANQNNLNIFCCRGNCNISMAIPTTLLVFDMPKPVANFQCVVYNQFENINCSWDLTFDYSPEGANVTLQWHVHNSDWMPCPSMHSTFCLWMIAGDGNFMKKTAHFRLLISSRCGINVVSEHTVDMDTVVKPAAALAFQSHVDNSSCVTVMWNTTKNGFDKIHFVNYTSKWGSGKKTLVDTNVESTSKTMTVCDLHPYTMYTFTVQIKPLTDGYLSDPVKTTAQTYSDVPAAGPEVKEGGYMWNPKDCIQGNDQRQTYIYWKLLPEELMNGILTAIQLRFKPSVVNNDAPADVTHVSYLLTCNQDYNISIHARNINGTSRNGSSLYIPKAQTSLQPQTVVEIWNVANVSNITITWKHSDVETKGYTVFWCKKDQGNCAKNASVYWIVVNGNTHHTTLTNISSPEDSLYGVSMDTENGSSGLSWQSCIYIHGVAPTKSPKNVIVMSGHHDNSLEIRWDKLECEFGEPFISIYRVEICRGENALQCGDPRCLRTDSNENQLVVEELKAEHWYNVKVQGVTTDKLHGPCSESVLGKPVNKSLKTKDIVGIAFGGLFVLVLVIVGSCFLLGNCLEICRKYFNFSITTPDNIKEMHTNHPPPGCGDNVEEPFINYEVTGQQSQDSDISDGLPAPLPIDECKPLEKKPLPADYIQFCDIPQMLKGNDARTNPEDSG